MQSEDRCIHLAQQIKSYLNTVGAAYDENPEQMSTKILTVMDLWKHMDEAAVETYGLLKEYSTGFPSGIMGCLQVSRPQDMLQLQGIEAYIKCRNTGERKAPEPRKSIFQDPTEGCFAERYFDQSNKLYELRQKIERETEAAMERKKREWDEKNLYYQGLVVQYAKSKCEQHIVDAGLPTRRIECRPNCLRCEIKRKMNDPPRTKIRVYESPLPSDPTQAKAVVFELACPEAFVQYREATWNIIGTLAVPNIKVRMPIGTSLRNYSGLSEYSEEMFQQLSLTSTRKEFWRTHWGQVSFPVKWADVCLGNTLKPRYFDTVLRAFPFENLQALSFARHCHLTISSDSPFVSFRSDPDFGPGGRGRSSYKIIAEQTKCPSDLSVHEFNAFQSLFAGHERRWPQILLELGSSNLSFSTEAAALLISQLALQVGPMVEDDYLGIVHRIFRDESFCRRLTDQLVQRLDQMSSNWREPSCMKIVITLLLRLYSLGSLSHRDSLKALLKRARTITLDWINLLSVEILTTTDDETTRACNESLFWASLHCRRTFEAFLIDNTTLEPSILEQFIQCSVTLQHSSVLNPADLPSFRKNALVRDLKMVYRMRSILKRSLEADHSCLVTALSIFWPALKEASSSSFSGFSFLEEPYEWWVEVTLNPSKYTRQQKVLFHLLAGYFLVDGKPIGKLPTEYSRNKFLRDNLGDQPLLALPSGMTGMTFMLPLVQEGHQVHLGWRGVGLVIRAQLNDGQILELVHPTHFRKESAFDFPAPLIDDCAHWINIETGVMEIRGQANIWQSSPDNWRVDFKDRRAYCRDQVLIDPQSSFSNQVSAIFDGFEERQQIIMTQAAEGDLEVLLKRLELSFFVNKRQLLECKLLHSEIDSTQDVGTWYGLRSMIVLRGICGDSSSSEVKRLIIVPTGNIEYDPDGQHISISISTVSQTTPYATFVVNDALRRLDCTASEFQYLKAALHAYTSLVVPDPLTGRTGTEEAFHCLQSGYCQPWKPITPSANQSLILLAQLTPRREYYPTESKVMQTVEWHPSLPTTIQHDGFRAIVESIHAQSAHLSLFSQYNDELPSLPPAGDKHLNSRSRTRYEAYKSANGTCYELVPVLDHRYVPGDRLSSSKQITNVLETSTLIRNWSSKLPVTQDLAGILQNWPLIGGFNTTFDRPLLSDLFNVDFGMEWGALVNTCRAFQSEDIYHAMFLLGTMSFCENVNMGAMRTLIAFSILQDLKALTLPKWVLYEDFRSGQAPRAEDIKVLINPCLTKYDATHHGEFPLMAKIKKQRQKRQREQEKQQATDTKAFSAFVLKQWPCPEPTIVGFSVTTPTIADVSQALDLIRPKWTHLYQNRELSQHISRVQKILYQHQSDFKMNLAAIKSLPQEVFPTRARGGEIPTLQNLLSATSFPSSLTTKAYTSRAFLKPLASAECTLAQSDALGKDRATEELRVIFESFSLSDSLVRQKYGKDLMRSLEALLKGQDILEQQENTIDSGALLVEIRKARDSTKKLFDSICTALEQDQPAAQWMKLGGLWPSITPATLLENLRSTSNCQFGSGMKETLLAYGTSITFLQHLIRIEDAHRKGSKQKLVEELKNFGHENWNPADLPDWLLLEIDANMLIRPGQVEVARATISPDSQLNSVLQMNMGSGKTSCIIPMAACVLADGANLLRIITPRQLLAQVGPLMHARLGGLVGRRLKHIPYSRRTLTSTKTMSAFETILQDTLKDSGVILALPEHMLSFKLSGLQRLSDKQTSLAKKMIELQEGIESTARDIIDESDYTLSFKTQLIYPSGSQAAVDGHPIRWEIAQTLLKMIESHLYALQKEHPQSIEVSQRDGFPLFFILRKDVEDALLSRLVNGIVDTSQISILPRDCTLKERAAIKVFISEYKVSEENTRIVQEVFVTKPASKPTIHTLRGYFVTRILLMTLKKRWNVEYGLHPGRAPVAVPFLAKGTPSEQSEWGHPDVSIVLTCLAFYYEGINTSQLKQVLEHVIRSDEPSQIYQTLCCDSNLPASLKEWNVINLGDKAQLSDLWQHLRSNTTVIDYYLNRFVFPQHAKQFQQQLQASGWDIPLFTASDLTTGNTKRLTTGFSGTNDCKDMLPLTIEQRDLQSLEHTNAEVLTYLLRPRSRRYVLAADANGKRLTEKALLRKLEVERIRVLIDAGAQVLELDNETLAKSWLEIDSTAPAAIYFRGNDPWVMYRHGLQMPLLASPFAEDLGQCVVYIDQSHTRGTDLKLPPTAKGALTLGLGQTKDHTVQAAMRLRQLATSQSVVFFATPEVHQSITDLCGEEPNDSSHVIRWLLEQTCCSNEQYLPSHISQGYDFCRRTQAALDYPEFLSDLTQRETYMGLVQPVIKQSLDQLYGIGMKSKPKKISLKFCDSLSKITKKLDIQRKAFEDTGRAVQNFALQEVEQEREVEVEMESVREVQRQIDFSPFNFPGLHKDIESFARTGRLLPGADGYQPAFGLTLRKTQLGRKYMKKNCPISSKLFVSLEFTKTVTDPFARSSEDFMRPVNWILWSPTAEVGIVVIPEEAEILLPLVREASPSRTNLITYAAPVTRRMLHFDDLSFYAVPSLPSGWKAPSSFGDDLRLFAGALYTDFSGYVRMCDRLGVKLDLNLPSVVHESQVQAPVVTYASICRPTPKEEKPENEKSPFQMMFKKPVEFAHDLLAARRKGQDFAQTPMGYLCQSRPLTEDHHFFANLDENVSTEEEFDGKTNSTEEGGLGVDEGLFDEGEKVFDDTQNVAEDDSS